MAKESPRFDIMKFDPPGPVAAAYIKSEGPIDLIRGPWGSGKTVGTVFKLVRHAGALFPVCKDGRVHVRAAAIRDTYREMAKTALSSWHMFFPRSGPFTRQPVRENYSGGQDRPVKHVLEWDVVRAWPEGPRKTPVIFEMEFGAIGEQNLESFFKGYELSMGWVNECDLCHPDTIARLYGRTARFPPRDEIMEWEGERLGYEPSGPGLPDVIRLPRVVMGDFNPPDESNYLYEREIENPQNWPKWNFFAQPSGMSPDGENRRGKTRADYEAEEAAFGGPKTAESRRNVHGEYAAVKSGTVVYDRFSLAMHKADGYLEPVRELPLYLGFDGGGQPACGIGQFMPDGQFRGLREVTTTAATVTGPDRFAEYVLETLLRDFSGMAVARAWGDPSDFHGADKERGELAMMEIVGRALGVSIMPTETNDITSRTAAMNFYLDGFITAGRPRGVWDPRCKRTVRGFVSQYRLTKAATAGRTDRLEIEKNEFSHIMNAWEYLLYGYRGRTNTIRDAARLGRPDNVTPLRSIRAKADFNVWEA